VSRVPPHLALCIASLMVGLSVTGCVAPRAPDPTPAGPGSARTSTGEVPAPQDAIGRVLVGRSTRSDVVAQLGPAIVIPFDSGYEVWLYRWRGADMTPRSATELVVLFDPSGVATKARVRPGYTAAK
jgi:hypothetical protein